MLYEFHSDAEKGLGPIVAGLSLGSPAKMIFRVRKKYFDSSTLPMTGKRPRKNSPHALTLFLQHGDICVMEGAAIQDRYEFVLSSSTSSS